MLTYTLIQHKLIICTQRVDCALVFSCTRVLVHSCSRALVFSRVLSHNSTVPIIKFGVSRRKLNMENSKLLSIVCTRVIGQESSTSNVSAYILTLSTSAPCPPEYDL